MVKIIEGNEEVNERFEKARGLAEITREFLGRNYSVGTTEQTGKILCSKRPQQLRDPNFYVLTKERIIKVHDRKTLRTAVKLAKAYEKNGEEEYSVVKMY